jgi:hypothetical protein
MTGSKQMIVSRVGIPQAIAITTEQIKTGIRMGYFRAETNGRVPTIFVGKISARRYNVLWNYLPIDTAVAQVIKPCHPEDFIGSCIVYAIVK